MSKTIKEVPEALEMPLDAASNCTDNQSETESISEEERVKRLFAICDADGDGFIDRLVQGLYFIVMFLL